MKTDESKRLDEIIDKLDREVREVKTEIRILKQEFKPVKKHKTFIEQLAEDFIYSKERKIRSYNKRRR